jgi:hypothetical protein
MTVVPDRDRDVSTNREIARGLFVTGALAAA